MWSSSDDACNRPALRQEIHESLTSSPSSHLDRDAHLHSILRLKDQGPAQDRPFTGVRSMGPDLHRREREDKVKGVVAFAVDLEKTLRSNDLSSTPVAALYKQCDRVLLLQGAGVVDRIHDLDARGTRLWNLASKLKHGSQATTESICLGLLFRRPTSRPWLRSTVRVLACLLLDCAQRSSQGSVANDIRVLKSTLRTTKQCLGVMLPSE